MIPGFFEDVQMFLHDRQETHSYAIQMDWINVYFLLCASERKLFFPNWITGRLSARLDQIISFFWFTVERPIPTFPNSDMLSLWPDLRAIFIVCIVLNIYKSRFFFKIKCVLLKLSGSWESVYVLVEMTLCWSDKSTCFSGGDRYILVYTYNAIGKK